MLQDTVRDRMADTVRPAVSDLRMVEDPARTSGIGCHRSAALTIVGTSAEGDLELGESGCTDWTPTLNADAKERCLISCVSTDRLSQLYRPIGGS